MSTYVPETADIDEGWLIFYDHMFALGRCQLHEDQDYDNDVPGAIELWPDDAEDGRPFIRLKPETLRIFERRTIPDRGDVQVYFDSEVDRDCILDLLPALRDECYRRAYFDDVERWERHPAHDDENLETPPHPVFEPARVEWEAWQAALASKSEWSVIEPLYKAYEAKVPMPDTEPKAEDSIRRLELYGPPGNALIGQTNLVIATLAARQIDRFNEGWASTERWPDAPQLPPACDLSFPAIFRQLNSAIRRIVTVAQKPRTFRVDAIAHILAIVAHVHKETHQELVKLIRENKCALPEPNLASAHKKFEQSVMWELQGKSLSAYYVGKGDKPDPANFDNVRVFLNLRGIDLQFDEFTNAMEVCEGFGYDWQWQKLDEDKINALWLDAHSIAHNFHCSRDFFRTGLERIAREFNYDSLRDTVNTLRWDGTERLGNWLTHAIGSPDDAYHRAVGINLIGGLVKRAREPGAKHDETVLLISPEGTSKSLFCETLALRPEWFTDSIQIGGRPQDVIPQLKGKQVIELAELDGLSRAETNNVKAFMSRKNDHATLKYDRDAREHLRRHIFIGTTNEDAPLISQTGNRRWLPVHVVGKIDIEWVRENIRQLYAEAARWHADGEDFRIPEALWAVAGQHQDAARKSTGAEDVLAHAFGDQTECYVLASDVQAFASERKLPLQDMRAALKRLGFKSTPMRDNGDVRKVWRRGRPEAAVRFKLETFVNRPAELMAMTLPPCPVLPPLPAPRGNL